MQPGKFPIHLEQGVGYLKRMTWRSGGIVVPISSYAGRLEVRHPDGMGELMELTSAPDGGLVLADDVPNIAIHFTIEQVEELADAGLIESEYRLVLTPPGDIEEGIVLLRDAIDLGKW